MTEVIGGDIDFVRPRIVEFTAQAPTILDTKTGLESVVVSVGGVLLLVDAAPTLIRAIQVCI